ncbi:unnamed protein product [Gongylonema pulchrum]|uniref:Paired amphipathic helix protein Sin3a n=1 Tax=Gongylonema pulchrum TaxID=637853 RepID=A0A183DHR1_9BILA|nr:unnamed protein product [Gongylonema pulchrum]
MMYSDGTGGYNYPLDNSQMMTVHGAATQDMSGSAAAYWSNPGLTQHQAYSQLTLPTMPSSYSGMVQVQGSTAEDEYARALSAAASTAYPVPVSASVTPAGGDVVEIGKVRSL